ncbi:pilus assembly protein [Enterovibrio norvegicus FF-33]|uniref:Pilus assembly protein n=1 Tax=Enterovibrio norvegicus FF-454 TaxID=1185651 RepID=A0A1E5C3E8_9GAMM|nr:Flp family type IVb pilin [Enterovibrio norvegicus]OEE60056.1 pilus assembly protein [Enterovibrio norvegicus FF-454]OEE66395.1 pilus assembly protein [Enterovibrio norvegicus FF-33]OEE89788.1 pilus assembly protein [Enterovibrio norvegicus FF-162]
MFKIAKQYIQNESGVTAVEYAILGVAMSIIVLAALSQNSDLHEALKTAFVTIQTNINNAGS